MDEKKEYKSIRKEMREGIKKRLYKIKKEMKKILEGMEENKKKECRSEGETAERENRKVEY